MAETKKTLVIGASENPARYSYMAVQKLKDFGYPVIALGRELGKIGDTHFITEFPTNQHIDTVTLYINPALQKLRYDPIKSFEPISLVATSPTLVVANNNLPIKSNVM